MKKIIFTLLIYVCSNFIYAQSYTETVIENNKFSFELFKDVFTKESNSFISPYSISSALAMTYGGAKNNTEKQMADVLNFKRGQIKTHEGFSNLNTYFKQYKSDTSSTLSIANAIWKDVNWHFKLDYLELTKNYYETSIYPLETVKEINSWVSKETRNKIPEIVSEDDIQGSRMVLTNAIYFKSNWFYSFKKEKTKLDNFNGHQVKMMCQKNQFKYFDTGSNQVIELPYENNKFSMVVVLPRDEEKIEDLINELDYSKYQSYLNALKRADINLRLPKFKIEKKYSINNNLKSMGMTDAFNVTKADFTGMSTGLSIGNVIHKSFIEVNEEGAEAAAATAVVMIEKSSRVRESIDFNANRPFVFILKDNESNSILFIGAIINPLE